MKKKIFYSVSFLLPLLTVIATVCSYIKEEKEITSRPGYSGVDLLALTVYPLILIFLLFIELLLLSDVKFFIGLSEKRCASTLTVRALFLLLTVGIILICNRGLSGPDIKLAEAILMILSGVSIIGRLIYTVILQMQKTGSTDS